MTKTDIINTRNRFNAMEENINIEVMLPDDLKFTSLDSFLIWDDNNEILTVICPNEDTLMGGRDSSRRGKIFVAEYTDIVYLAAIPNLATIDKWLPDLIKSASETSPLDTDVDRIKNSFKAITDQRYFL